jgi:hypothetical protein
MGLDITAYEKLEASYETVEDIEEGTAGYSLYTHKETEFENSSTGLLLDTYYDSTGEEYGFRAGSYGGYNQWRNQLSFIVNNIYANDLYKEYQTFERIQEEGFKMAELIYFSDCDGYIGPEVCQKLYVEFRDNEQFAKDYAEQSNDEHFYVVYKDFLEAFKIVGDAGAVSFH